MVKLTGTRFRLVLYKLKALKLNAITFDSLFKHFQRSNPDALFTIKRFVNHKLFHCFAVFSYLQQLVKVTFKMAIDPFF